MMYGSRFACISLALAMTLSASSEVVEEIVIKVNDSIVTKSEYEKRIESTREGMRREYKGPDLDRKLREIPSLLLRQMEEELLLIEKARQMYQVELLVDYQVENVMNEYGMKTQDELARALAQEGLTIEEFRKQMLMIYVPEFIKSREIRSHISLTRDEIESYYGAHKAELVPEKEIRLQEILLSKDLVTPEDAAGLAAEITAQVAAGRSFGELASRYSNASSRSNEGDAGWFKPGDLSGRLSEVLFGTPVGKVTPLLETEAGWYVFLVAEAKEPAVPTLEEARERIVDILREQKFQEEYERYIDKLREENYVRINPKYI